MSRKIEAIEMISGQLDVVEAKLDAMLKKFGFDDDDLWIIRRCTYNDTRELAEKTAQHFLEKFEQPDLFSNIDCSDCQEQ